MIEIELDGRKVEIAEGSMVMHAADKAGTYIPHFCYHKKLSIAANCRMCLVDIEKAPKPMPACATTVTQGMIVRTKSDKALKAQQSVMEFLLINHPLDCPICDQGGECQLQDLAVGYGGSTSRYQEEKRVVFHKDVGPLISMQEMSRCIHCTRCVRFGQEVAGVMELGMIHRGEHSEITTVVGDTVDSELSGNMIDVCPVGALTSKPFRYSARTWELSRRKSVSPHDSTGANLIVQVKSNKVMRVVPLENEAVNECWIADRDRFSYEAVNSDLRLTSPMIKQGGEWKTVDWTAALQYVANGLAQIKADHGASSIDVTMALANRLSDLSLETAESTSAADRDMIFSLIQSQPGGFGAMDGFVRRGIRSALILTKSHFESEFELLDEKLRAAASSAEAAAMSPATRASLQASREQARAVVARLSLAAEAEAHEAAQSSQEAEAQAQGQAERRAGRGDAEAGRGEKAEPLQQIELSVMS
jgi:NADH-quinone oxidoreductase subunit G